MRDAWRTASPDNNNFRSTTPEGRGCIGIGADNISAGSGIIFSVTNQAAYSPAPNIISLVANAVSSANWPAPGNTPYSFAVARIPEDPNGPDAPIDFIVDGYGHTGVGTMDPQSKLQVYNIQEALSSSISNPFPNSFQVTRNIIHMNSGPGYTRVNYDDFVVASDGMVGVGVLTPAAHLDIADQNNDGVPLLNVKTYSSTDPALHIAANGVVGIGAIPGTGTGAAMLQVNGTGTFNGNVGVANDLYVDYDAHIDCDAEMDNLYVDASSYMTGNVAIQQSMSVAKYVQIGSTSPLTSPALPELHSGRSYYRHL